MNRDNSSALPPWANVVLGIAIWGTVLYMATRVDRGFTALWPTWGRGAWFVGMIVLVSVGGVFFLRGTGGDERRAWLPLVALVSIGIILGLGWLLREWTGLSIWSTVLASGALIVGWGAWRRPWWFWEDWRAEWLCRLIGDRWARLVYAAAAILLAVGAVKVALR